MVKARRKSIDSSDSDSSSGSDHSKKQKRVKKDKHPRPQSIQSFSSPPFLPPNFDLNREQAVSPSFPAPHGTPEVNRDQFTAPPFPSHPPPSYGSDVPPSGYRLPLKTTSAFPEADRSGPPPFYDADGRSPVFIGSALFERSVHPCKIGPHLSPFALVPYGGGEYGHHGRFDLLPFDSNMMEWVPTSHGKLPPGRRPIEGGYEDSGQKLYHGYAVIDGIKVPGKTGEHLNGCNIAFGGQEIAFPDHQILCWK